MTMSCAGSSSSRRAVPGLQRSKSIAPSSSSASSSRTVESPHQKRRPRISSRPSICGMPSLSTADVPSWRVAETTYEQLTPSPSNGAPSLSDHSSSTLRSTSGRRSSQAVRSGDLRQFAAKLLGMVNDIRLIVVVSVIRANSFETAFLPARRMRRIRCRWTAGDL
jgi:hypothetical protein